MESSDLLNCLIRGLFAFAKKKFLREAFSTLDVYKNILGLVGLKCELKSVYAAEFAMQELNIQNVTEIIPEFERKQHLAEVTKLQRLIMIIRVTSASCERSSILLKRLNNYMRCSRIEERLHNLVLIFMNNYLLKTMKIELGGDTFYNKVIDKFTKKKRRIELVYK